MIPIFNRLTLNEWVLMIFVYTEKILSFVISSIISITPLTSFSNILKKESDINQDKNASTIDKRQDFKISCYPTTQPPFLKSCIYATV